MGLSLGKVILVSSSILAGSSSAEWPRQGSGPYSRRYPYDGQDGRASSSKSPNLHRGSLGYQARAHRDEYGANGRLLAPQESRTIASRHRQHREPLFTVDQEMQDLEEKIDNYKDEHKLFVQHLSIADQKILEVFRQESSESISDAKVSEIADALRNDPMMGMMMIDNPSEADYNIGAVLQDVLGLVGDDRILHIAQLVRMEKELEDLENHLPASGPEMEHCESERQRLMDQDEQLHELRGKLRAIQAIVEEILEISVN